MKPKQNFTRCKKNSTDSGIIIALRGFLEKRMDGKTCSNCLWYEACPAPEEIRPTNGVYDGCEMFQVDEQYILEKERGDYDECATTNPAR